MIDCVVSPSSDTRFMSHDARWIYFMGYDLLDYCFLEGYVIDLGQVELLSLCSKDHSHSQCLAICGGIYALFIFTVSSRPCLIYGWFFSSSSRLAGAADDGSSDQRAQCEVSSPLGCRSNVAEPQATR